MKTIVTILSVVFTLNSCNHKSELKTEKGFVMEKKFVPEYSDSHCSLGMTTDGKAVIVDQSTFKPEQFYILFKCQHNTVFSTERKDLYTVLNAGDSVIIYYYEILDDVENTIEDYQFVTAKKIINH